MSLSDCLAALDLVPTVPQIGGRVNTFYSVRNRALAKRARQSPQSPRGQSRLTSRRTSLDNRLAAVYKDSTAGPYGRDSHMVKQRAGRRIKTTLVIPEDLLWRLKAAAAEEHIAEGVSGLLCRVAEEWLSSRKRKG